MLIETIKNKTALENQLFDIMSKYIYKYIYRIYNKEIQENGILKSLYVDFQLHLIKIAKWSDSHIEKEYYKFLKWCKKKYDMKEKHIVQLFEKLIVLSIKVILNKSNIYTESILETYHFPKFHMFYYKYLKKCCRFFYENPKLINNGIPSSTKKIMLSLINDSLPIKQIINIIECSNKKSCIDENSYKTISELSNCENVNIQQNDNLSNITTKPNLIVNKSESEKSLQYMSSEEFQNEYFNDNKDESEINKKNKDDTLSNDNQIKHINVPKYKKNPFFYNNKKINEINENFFDN